MPNWCFNSLKVSGPSNRIVDFKVDTKGEDSALSFNALVPLSDEKVEGFAAWDENVCPNRCWGTKWDAIDVSVSGLVLDSRKSYFETFDAWICYSFTTAWGPPEEWLRRVCKLYPDLVFSLDCKLDGSSYYCMMVGVGGILKEVFSGSVD